MPASFSCNMSVKLVKSINIISLSLIADLTTCDVNVSLGWISKGVALFKNLLSGPITRISILEVKNI